MGIGSITAVLSNHSENQFESFKGVIKFRDQYLYVKRPMYMGNNCYFRQCSILISSILYVFITHQVSVVYNYIISVIKTKIP